MAELSPVAKAVWEAWLNASDGHYDGGEWVPHHADSLAAALRALANQAPNGRPKDRWISAREIFAIAAELEGGKATTPEPAAGPTDEDVLALRRALREQGERADLPGVVRAALARYGNQPTTEPVAGLPPRPPLQSPAGRSDLVRYGVTWDGSPDKPLLTPMPDGYWTPWHLAAQPPQPIPLSDPPGSCPASGL